MADFELLAPGGHQKLVDEVVDRLDTKADIDALSPLLTAGAALGITGDEPTDSAEWLQRTSTSDGPTTVKSIHGRTVVWNQRVENGNFASVSGWKVDNCTIAVGENVLTATTGSGESTPYFGRTDTLMAAGHKYLASVEVNPSDSLLAVVIYMSQGNASLSVRADNLSAGVWKKVAGIVTIDNNPLNRVRLYFNFGSGASGKTLSARNFNIFDLTAMFGAGSEPSTVAEFESLYPLPYYPYDAGSLLPVNMTGVETVGANLWGGDAMHDDVQSAALDTVSGENVHGRYIMFSAPRVSNKVLFAGPFKPDTRYTFMLSAGKNNTSGNLNMRVYYTDGTYNNVARTATDDDGTPQTVVLVSTAGKTVDRVQGVNSSGNTYLYYDGCGVFEGVHTVDEFKPYWQQQRTIDVSTYYPQGMNGVSGFYDKLTETKAITRMHTVTLDGTQDNVHYLLNTSREVTTASIGGTAWTAAGYPEPMHGYSTVKLLCDALPTLTSDYKTWPDGTKGIAVWSDNSAAFVIAPTGDKTITTEDQFKAWLAQNPLTITYAVATPTVTTIDPPLNLTYRTEQGGTERVMVPTGELSAPPTIVTAQGYTAESLRDAALSAIAPVENGLASANYAVGAYLVHGGQLCKVTTAIATGEAISIGTNVVTTTVMAEVLSLTQ